MGEAASRVSKKYNRKAGEDNLAAQDSGSESESGSESDSSDPETISDDEEQKFLASASGSIKPGIISLDFKKEKPIMPRLIVNLDFH